MEISNHLPLENHSNCEEKEAAQSGTLVSYEEKLESVPVNIENEEFNSELSKSTRAVRARRKLLAENLEELLDPGLEKKKKSAKKLKATRMKTLNMGKKMEIIEMIDQKISSKLIRSIYRLKSSTFYDIKKSADKIREYAKDYQSMQDQRWERKTMRKMQFPEIETAVYDWFLQQKSAGVTIRGIDIRETAKMFALHFKEENFKASAGWLFQFRKRHSLITRSNKSKKKIAAAQKAAEEAAAIENDKVDSISKVAKNASKSNNPKHGKYPRSRALTVGQKMKVVEMIEESISPKKIMTAFKLKRSTFYDIKRDAGKIKEFTKNNDNAGIEESSDRRSMKKMGYPEIDKSAYSWYLEQKAAGVPVRGVDIQHAAEKIAGDLKNTSFKASSGWLFRFRKRHGLAKLSIVRTKSNKSTKKKTVPASAPPANSTEGVTKQNNTDSISYMNQTQIVNGSLPNNSINISGQTQFTLPSQSIMNTSSPLTSHGHHNLIAQQHQHYHLPDNSQHCLAQGQQQQSLLLSTRTLQPMTLTAHQPLNSQHPITISSRHPLEHSSHPSSRQHPLQLANHHHNIQAQHQPIQFASHQQLALTNHQQFNLNSLNNQYQINTLHNPYHQPSK